MHRRLGPCSCAGLGVAPLFLEGLFASGCSLVEVQGGMRSPGRPEQPENNTPLGIAGCPMESKGPPLRALGPAAGWCDLTWLRAGPEAAVAGGSGGAEGAKCPRDAGG